MLNGCQQSGTASFRRTKECMEVNQGKVKESQVAVVFHSLVDLVPFSQPRKFYYYNTKNNNSHDQGSCQLSHCCCHLAWLRAERYWGRECPGPSIYMTTFMVSAFQAGT